MDVVNTFDKRNKEEQSENARQLCARYVFTDIKVRDCVP